MMAEDTYLEWWKDVGMERRPLAVAFDVVETLFSLDALRPKLEAIGLPPESLEIWFLRTLRDGFALASAGEFRPMLQVAVGALEVLLHQRGINPDPSTTDDVLKGLLELPPQADVEPAMQALRDAGVRMVTLSNSGADMSRTLLERAGLGEFIERVISVDEVGRWKPHPDPYVHACKTLAIPRERLCLLSAHGWDIFGGRQAGLTCGWVSRVEGRLPSYFDPAHVTGATLVEVVGKLLRL
jgi:2-haloacid dehalogenase